MGHLAEAIAAQESNGNYRALGAPTKYGRAIGKFQVLPSNVGPWTKKYYGRELSPSEFYNNHEAQDIVGQGRMADYYRQYGNHADVASAWFSGKPLTGNTNTDPALRNKTVPSYVNEVAQKYNNMVKT